MATLGQILTPRTIERLGWTLIHSLWETVAIALLLLVGLRILKRRSANARYLGACVAIALVVVAPAVTFLVVDVTEPVVVEVVRPVALPPASVGVTEVMMVEELEGPSGEATVIEEPAVPLRERITMLAEPALPYVVFGWFVGVFGLSVWHLGGLAQLKRLRRRMVKPVGEALRGKMIELGESLRVRQAVELVESALVQVPTVVGWVRPVILLPASAVTGLTSEQLEALLAHELAHIRRYDYLVNMLQTVVEILGFYHPAVWWISHRIRSEREDCCDDMAVQVTGDRVRYAKALTTMEEIRGRQNELAVAASGGSLLRRIGRLVGRDTECKTRSSWAPAAVAVAVILTLAIPTALALTRSYRDDLKGNSAAIEPGEGWVAAEEIVDEETKAGDIRLTSRDGTQFVHRNENGVAYLRMGFARLKEVSRDIWEVEKPHMSLIQEDFECQMTAERGSFQVETSVGDPTPKDAKFSGNVVIRIVPKGRENTEESHIYADELTFQSADGHFIAGGPVRCVSGTAELRGERLEFVCNEETRRPTEWTLSGVSIEADLGSNSSISGDFGEIGQVIESSQHGRSVAEVAVSATTASPGPVAVSGGKAGEARSRADVEAEKVMLESRALLSRGPAGIIEARDKLNGIRSNRMTQQEARKELGRLAEKWLFSGEVLDGDELCSMYTVRAGDTLSRVAGRYKVPYEILMEINGISRPDLLKVGQEIKVIHGPFSARIYRSSRVLDLYLQNMFVRSFGVAVGKAETETPTGLWEVEEGGKLIAPPWTDSETGKVYRANDPGYPLGTKWIGLKGLTGDAKGRQGFAIHGTKDPDSIGTAASRGCIRMHNKDVELLYKLLAPVHSKVVVEDRGAASGFPVFNPINGRWDQPVPIDQLRPRIIDLRDSDPVETADLLNRLFSDQGSPSGDRMSIYVLLYSTSSSQQRIVGPLYGQVTFEDVPGTRKIIVISRIPEAYDAVEQLILDLAREEIAEAPKVIESKYANPQYVADRIRKTMDDLASNKTSSVLPGERRKAVLFCGTREGEVVLERLISEYGDAGSGGDGSVGVEGTDGGVESSSADRVTKVFELECADAKEVCKAIYESMYAARGGAIEGFHVYVAGEQVMAMGTAEDIRTVEALVRVLDTPALSAGVTGGPRLDAADRLRIRQEVINNDPVVRQLGTEIAQIEKSLIEDRQKFTERHPEIIRRKELLDAMNKRREARITEIGEAFDLRIGRPGEAEKRMAKVFVLENADGKEVASAIETVRRGDGGASEGPGGMTVTVDDRTNKLIVYGTEEELRSVQETVEELDRPMAQVLIDLHVVELFDGKTLDRETRTLIGNLADGAGGDSGAGSVGSVLRHHWGEKMLSDEKATRLLNLLREKGYLKAIHASPRILMNDKNMGKVATTSTGDKERGEEEEGFDFSIEIKPEVREDNVIVLEIDAELDCCERIGTAKDHAGKEVPLFDRRQTSTTSKVAVRDEMYMLLGLGGTETSGEGDGESTSFMLFVKPSVVKSEALVEKPGEEEGRRVESMQRLKKLGLALVMFADDNDGKFPKSLGEAKPYLGEQEYAKLKGVVRYVGADMKQADGAKLPLAIDQDLLERVGGTSVLFADGHVELVKRERLKKIGVGTAEIQIEARFLAVSEEFLKSLGLEPTEPAAVGSVMDSTDIKQVKPGTKHMLLDDLSVNLLLRAAQKDEEATVLTSPKVMVIDEERAEVCVMSEIAVVKGYREADKPGGKPEPEVEMTWEGIRFDITPHLTDDEKQAYIEMGIEVQSVLGFEEHKYEKKYEYKTPIIERTKIQSAMMIPLGKTMLIYGRKIRSLGGLVGEDGKNKGENWLLVLIKASKGETLGQE